MNPIANRQAICEVLLRRAATDRDLVVACSDSRGSASLGKFAQEFPGQFVEVGIAEQNLVSISAGLAACGKKVFAASPACFLSTRSMEQVRVDVAYSNTNVKLIGISGGVSYGPLGMTHHSTQDIAVMASMPNMRVYLPSDRFQTEKLVEALLEDDKPAYLRVGRNPVPDVYSAQDIPFTMDRATLLRQGTAAALIACGELVAPALEAARQLALEGISCRVLDMYCLKPIDRGAVARAARETRAIVTLEEHGAIGGLGALVCQIACAARPLPVRNLALPDAPAIAGQPAQVLAHYGLDARGICAAVKGLV